MPSSKCPAKADSERLSIRGFKQCQTVTKFLFVILNKTEKNTFSQLADVIYVHPSRNAACANIEFDSAEAAQRALDDLESEALKGKIVKTNFSQPILSPPIACVCESRAAELPPGLRYTEKTGNSVPSPTPLIEKTHVHQIYNTIAPHFSKTREIRWPQVEKFLSGVPPGSLVADIGCGNGKYFGSLPANCFVIGVDNCLGLLEIARGVANSEVLAGDAVSLPLKPACADYAISVALLHHISTLERRKQCAAEMLRVVKPKGAVFVCAWALEQDENSRFRFKAQDCLVDWNLQKKYFDEETEKRLIESGCEVDDKNKAIILKRFCHVFKEGELRELFLDLKDECEVEKTFYNSGNWCVVVRKK